jgi:hypothetical protein
MLFRKLLSSYSYEGLWQNQRCIQCWTRRSPSLKKSSRKPRRSFT